MDRSNNNCRRISGILCAQRAGQLCEDVGGKHIMELKMSNLTKEFRDMTAVKNVSYTMTTGVYGHQEKQKF